MQVRELADLGALGAVHGGLLIERAIAIPQPSLEGYWSASRCRFDRWHRTMKEFSAVVEQQPPHRHPAAWCEVRPTLEELLISELLTRIWTAVVCGVDRRRGLPEGEPIVRSVLVGQLEARNRALNLLVYSPGVRIEEAVGLNRLRRHVERWTDMLLGLLTVHQASQEFAFDGRRAEEFSRDFREDALAPDGRGRKMLVSSVHAAFQRLSTTSSPNEDLNRRIGSSILMSFPPELFDSAGIFRAHWMDRLARATNESAGMIDELLSLDARPAVDPTAPRRF